MDCEYADPDDILIDSITDGMHSKILQEKRLYQREELTLASAIKIDQQYELSQKQVRFVRDEDLTALALGHKGKRTKQKNNSPRDNPSSPKPLYHQKKELL